MSNIESIFGGAFTPPEPAPIDPPEVQFRDAIIDAGLEPPEHIVMDGTIHRWKSNGNKSFDRTGWYVAFSEGSPTMVFGDWRLGIEQTVRANIGRKLSAAEEMAALARVTRAKALRDEERTKTNKITASTVEVIWEGGIPATPDHPYLKAKGVQPHGAKVTGDGRLMVPLYGEDGHLSTLQYISDDSSKLYHPGGATGGKFAMIGSMDEAGVLYIAEGFATAATIHEQTGRPCVASYSASNLVPVMGKMREKYGKTQEIVIVADNDESGIGQKYADQATAKFGGRYIMPPVEGDANDYWLAGNDIKLLLTPQQSGEWLVSADSFCEQPAPIRWLVKHWLQENALIMVHGPSGGGKTFVVLDMCLRMASGTEEWMGNKVKAGSVVYLAGEGHQGLRGRVAAWKQNYGVSQLNMWVSQSGLDLNTPEGYAKVANNLRFLDGKPSLIVVDTLHRFLNGDENSSQDAKTMLDACASLMEEFGCSVILVHHTGVSDEAQHRARGSSAWRGALDIEISVVPARDGMPMELVQRKSKDAELAQTLFGRLQSVPINGWFDEDGEQVTSAVLVQDDAPMKVSKRSPVETTFIAAYKVCAEAGNILVENNQFIGIDKEVLRKYFYEMEGMQGKSVDAKKKAYSRVRDEFDNNDLVIDGNILRLNTPDATINEKRWVELFIKRQS